METLSRREYGFGQYEVQRFTSRDFERRNSEVVSTIIEAAGDLLKPDATLYDKLTVGNYTIGDVINPIYHKSAAVDVFSYKGDPIGWVFTWQGREQQRKHFYLPNEVTKAYFNKILHSTSKNYPAIAVALLVNQKNSCLNEGFSKEELSSKLLSKHWIQKPDKDGNNIVYYHKQYLTKDMLNNEPRIPIVLPYPDTDYNPKKLDISNYLDKSKISEDTVFSVRRLTSSDYAEAEDFNRRNSSHSTIKSDNLVYPYYALEANGNFIAMGGSVLEAILKYQGKIIPFIIAGNLVVDENWRNMGIASAFSYALKVNTFKRYPNGIIFADNVEATKNIWINNYHSKVVCTTGWMKFERDYN